MNKEVVVLHARWGNLITNIRILNSRETTMKHGKFVSMGGFGTIFEEELFDETFVIKCIRITSLKTRCKAIKEWFLTKIASAVKFGPQIR